MDELNTRQMSSNYNTNRGRMADMLSVRGAAILVTIGIILFFVGLLIGQFYMFVNDYDSVKVIYAVGRVIALIGDLMIVIPLYIVGITGQSVEWKIRATMVSSATALMIITMILGLSFSTLPSYYMYT